MAKKSSESKAVTTAQLEQVRKMLKDKGIDKDAFQLGLDRGIIARALDQIKIDSSPVSLIRVDRSICPAYPDWMREVIHPKLEKMGPAEYHISQVEQWLHHGQKNGGVVKGQIIYDHLQETDSLKTCLGSRDLEEIQKKGIAFFREHFQGKAVFGWKGVVRDSNGGLDVPYLCEFDGRVVLDWLWLAVGWLGSSPALRLAKSAKA